MPSFSTSRFSWRLHWQFTAFALVVMAFAGAVGTGFYLRGRALMEGQLRQRLQEAAAVAAEQFDAHTIQAIRGTGSLASPGFMDTVRRLRDVREAIPTIRYAYLMRRTEDPTQLEFVADADALASSAELDEDGNGTVDVDEEASYPGDRYDISRIPALQGPAFTGPVVDAEVTHDQWGVLLSGYAPVRDASGVTVAVLGVDMDAEEYYRLTRQIFSPVGVLLAILAAVLFAAYVALYLRNRRLDVMRRLDEERSGILLLTSHQLGTPMTIFQWTVEALRESRDKGTLVEDFEAHARDMDTALEHLRGLLTQLREAGQADRGAFAYRPERMYLRDLVVEVVHDLRQELNKKDIHVALDLDGNLQLSVDKTLIGGVVRELIQNAVHFSRPGSTVAVSARMRRGKAELSVRDEGCGIPSKDLDRVFDKFVRGSNAHLSRPNGTGLGLFVAHAVVRRAGGHIWIRSVEGKGTDVRIVLPLHPPTDPA